MSRANLVSLGKRLLPEWIVLLWLRSDTMQNNKIRCGSALDLDQHRGKSNVHESIGWIANMLVGSDETAAKYEVNGRKQQKKTALPIYKRSVINVK
jgi:hypothetical protein